MKKLFVVVLVTLAMVTNAMAEEKKVQGEQQYGSVSGVSDLIPGYGGCVSREDGGGCCWRAGLSGCETGSHDDLPMWAKATVVALSPVTYPAQVLATPWQGVKAGWVATDKIESNAGRVAVRVVMAPLWVPAAVLNLPSFLLSPLGLTCGY